MSTIIINKPDRLIVSNWPDHDPVAVWGIQAYSFLLPYNKRFTAKQLAKRIPDWYDPTEPHTAAVIEALNKLED